MRLKGKRVLITGAARGIGYGVAKRFLQEGARTVLLDYREEELQEAVRALSTTFPNHVYGTACDLSELDRLERSAKEAWSRWDGLDILINNAGIAVREPFLQTKTDVWDKILNVNLRSIFRLSQWVASRMIEYKMSGSIVNMSSKNGLSGSSMLASYNASKGGVQLLTQSMASELAAYNIRVNGVAPGFIDTPLDRELKEKETGLNLTERTPMKRLGSVEEVANAFLFLASDEASYITGTTLVVDGGHLANASEL